MFNQAPLTFNNLLLDQLSESGLVLLRPHLTRVVHRQNDLLYESDSRIDFVYFPTTCVVSSVDVMEDGKTIEVGFVGNEGLVGHSVAMRNRRSINRVQVQIGGASLRVKAAYLVVAADANDQFQGLMFRYNEAHMFDMAQSVACNGLHRLERRCCRWLLTARDRSVSDEIPITHAALANLLGVRRAGVSEVLAQLQAKGLLQSHRGTITIFEPEAIERLACECYQAIRETYNACVGPGYGRPVPNEYTLAQLATKARRSRTA